MKIDILPTRLEIKVALYDLRMKMSGYCFDAPWLMGTEGRGGYSHWRCQMRHGHAGEHRFNNYTWGNDRSLPTVFSPIPHQVRTPPPPGEVPGFARTYRQRRQANRWLALRIAERESQGLCAGVEE